MNPRLTELNKNEILLYLGHRGQEIDAALDEQIDRAIAAVCRASRPALVERHFPVTNGQIESLTLEGQDIANLLKDCHEAIIFAATLGADVERLLMRTEVLNMSDALIMDACASTAIENVCNNYEQDLKSETASRGSFLTDRFSPGYGDLPIACQNLLCSALDTARNIGLTVTRSNIMVPRKSVTAIIGIADREQEHRKPGCDSWSMFRTCPYRTQQRSCH